MQSNYLVIFIAAFFLLPACNNSTGPTETSEEHFEFVLYDGLSSSSISDISKELEDNYDRIIEDLQVRSMPQVTIRIWADYDNFLDAMETDIGVRYTGATGYVFGMLEFRLYYTNQASLDAVHEFAHLVSMQVNSAITNNPRWLWEAVALYESRGFVDPKTLPYMVSGDYPTLSELNSDFNNSNNIIYSVGYVLLEYVVQAWGMKTVIALIKANGNIPEVLGITTREFESGWYQFVKERYMN